MAGRKHRPEEIIGNPRSQKIQRQIAEIDTVRQKQRFSPEFKKWHRCPCGTEAAHLISYPYRSAARTPSSARGGGWRNNRRRTFGWCRTRWSCAALALTLTARIGLSYSRETVRRELHSQGYEWKRAKLKAKDDDPERARKLARTGATIECLRRDEAFFWVDELDIHLLAKVGYQWMLKGTQVEIPTPRQNQKQYLAGALDLRTGEIHYVLGPGKNNLLFRQLLAPLEERCGPQIRRLYVVADNYKIHKAKAVGQWLGRHPRVEVLWLPSYCPKANPIERSFGDVHDKCTRNHRRKRLHWLIQDVKQHLASNGPWQYKIPELYYEPEVEAELARLYLERSLRIAA